MEGNAYHALGGLLLYLWSEVKEKDRVLEELSVWENKTEWHKLIETFPRDVDLYVEDQCKETNTVFVPELYLKGTADVFVVDDKHLSVYDFKRSKAKTSKGEKNTKQYQLQASFYAKSLAKKFGCTSYSAHIILMQIATDLNEPFKTVSLTHEQIDKRYSLIQRMKKGEKVV